ncbi:MAG: hypothetical protein LBK02_09045 [Treponema sp.]|jgi:hypothetical protein|nr:hypothetical protein [Treponema sp.]
MKTLNFFGRAIVWAAVFLVLSCPAAPFLSFDRETFDRERKLWEAGDYKNYVFVQEYRNDAYPGGKVRITVSGSAEPVIENLDEWVLEHQPPETWLDNAHYLAPTITEIYERIDAFITEDIKQSSGENPLPISDITCEIKYNPDFHYPEEVDYVVGYNKPIDGGAYFDLKITDFYTLKD